jgi:hypothetical protein
VSKLVRKNPGDLARYFRFEPGDRFRAHNETWIVVAVNRERRATHIESSDGRIQIGFGTRDAWRYWAAGDHRYVDGFA